ncbi:YdiU family protein [soil metagenome]
MDLRFDNAFARQLPADPEHGPRLRQVQGALFSHVEPTPVAAPRLLAHSREMAATLGFDDAFVHSPHFAEVFAGNALLPGMAPIAANYGGHQFGHWAGQLGDGRAISLGELINAQGERWELQLKGAGPTPYSRSADGRAVLRSSVREFLCSEAMHHLGVPTTRALSLVATGEPVLRDMFYDGRPKHEPGAVVCRVAPSFIRFGNFELPSARGEIDLLRQLVEFTIRRDFGGDATPLSEIHIADWFAQVCARTATLMAHWMRVGFVHGVMNTDNMSILGLTIDYGPYGWIDDYDPDWTPNTTDRERRRYRFGTQPMVAFWNLSRLAGALAPLFGNTELLQAGLDHYAAAWPVLERGNAAAKLGLEVHGPADTTDAVGDDALWRDLLALLQAAEVDMTLWFRGLSALDLAQPSLVALEDAFYDHGKREQHDGALRDWLARYAARAARDRRPRAVRRAAMDAVNPRFVMRNYLAQEAIDRAEAGDASGVTDLLEVMRRPYDQQPGREAFAMRRPDWARDRAGCSMLSCSS